MHRPAKPFLTAALLAAAMTLGSTWGLAAPTMGRHAPADSAIVKVNDHQRKAQNNGGNRPASDRQRRRKNNNEAVAVGVGIAALVGAIALSQQSQAQPRGYDSGNNECRRLRWKCREGRGWACRKFDDVCR